ncbi:NADH-quinone oxidoreductase subunit NuoE [Rhodococcus sp. CSLK01-03]|uniref:NADH-quinone oxidoreductase subunit NuoE n=1 Tax=Rhodococcus indonesiensis TaxID=3055869 RepID=A0ABT7RMJ8_9NOCA|nr:NADH-quinone oxidoreductase subunit NuoE [Rhodococcus indonesiensis]MDM7488836.1 NADH-quinone oxidoreductase subunit NuoE [Rhodococcus indonesiensis]
MTQQPQVAIDPDPASGPVLIPFGVRPDEPSRLARPGAREHYPPDVRARLEADADEIVGRYPQPRSALLPLLHLVQSEDGYLTPAGVEFCAGRLGLTGAEVGAVATFYSMYRREPTGDYLVGVCTNTLCAIMGGDEILEALQQHLGQRPAAGTDSDPGSDTPPDARDESAGSVTLERLECNAACDFAPVVMVNWEFFDHQTPDSARALVDDLRAGRPVTPTRGAPLCTFRQTARILAGFPDERPGAVAAGGSAGAASLAGLRIARERGMRAPEPDHPSGPDPAAGPRPEGG